MKHTLAIVSAILLFSPQLLNAQDRKGDQEISVSYGIESGTDMIHGFQKNRTRPSYDATAYNSASFNSGNFFATYRYFLSRRLDLGVTLGTEFVSFGHYSNPRMTPPELLGTYKASITTLAVEFKPVYYNGSLIQLYGLIGLGGRYYSEHKTSGQNTSLGNLDAFPTVFFNSQWTPIAVRVGKDLSGFAELGFGYKGLVNAGVCYRFSRKPVKTAVATDK